MTEEEMVLLTFPIYSSSLDDVVLHNEMQWDTFSSSTYSTYVDVQLEFLYHVGASAFIRLASLLGGALKTDVKIIFFIFVFIDIISRQLCTR